MKKILKLLGLAIVVMGCIVVLMIVMPDPQGGGGGGDIESHRGKELQEEIDKLCSGNNWTEVGFKNLEMKIHTDKMHGNVSQDEELALKNYLFAASCKFLNMEVDNSFQQKSYSDSDIKSYNKMLDFLNSRPQKSGTNSNLTEASNILSEYNQLLSAMSYKGTATYTKPLKAFDQTGIDNAIRRIKSLKHYGSHFSKNSSVNEKLASLSSHKDNAEEEYYNALESAIERHYNSTSYDVEALLEDKIRFDAIAKKFPSAKSRLETYLGNYYKKK